MTSFFRLQAVLYLKRAGILLAVLGGTVLLFLVFQGGDWKKTKEALAFWKSKPQTRKNFSKSEEDQELGSFEEFLTRSSQQQLIFRLKELEAAPIENLAVHLDNQAQRIQIADKLIKMKNDPESQKFGILSKLTALRMLEVFKYDNAVSREDSVSELVEFTEQHLTSTESDIETQARLGQLAGLVINNLASADEPDFALDPRLFDMFTALSKQNVNDLKISTELLELLERIYVKTPASEHKRYVENFRDIYSESENENLVEMSALIGQKLNESEFELVNIFDSVESLRLEAAEKLRVQISDALELPAISELGYNRLFEGIRGIVRIRQFEMATKLSEKLYSRLKKEPGLKNEAVVSGKYLKQLQLTGKEFDFTGVFTIAGEPFSTRFPDADLKAVLFTTHRTFKQSDEVLFEMLKIAGGHVDSEEFCVTTIYLDPGTVAEASEGIHKASETVSKVDFCRVDIESEDGKKLLERIAILWSPMLLLLDRDNKVVGINVRPADFEKDFFELSGN